MGRNHTLIGPFFLTPTPNSLRLPSLSSKLILVAGSTIAYHETVTQEVVSNKSLLFEESHSTFDISTHRSSTTKQSGGCRQRDNGSSSSRGCHGVQLKKKWEGY
jgi:hypothetical protein